MADIKLISKLHDREYLWKDDGTVWVTAENGKKIEPFKIDEKSNQFTDVKIENSDVIWK
ncbi:hypothetical protein [Aequorivita vladivostokensis]|uniref:hypothetical protein n=1 Tax=Aequorivita vladivostokensis TaxID=171194 RepID=UPI0013F4870C|nr:hypothetical protein [Aequorivita vladivostokensis]